MVPTRLVVDLDTIVTMETFWVSVVVITGVSLFWRWWHSSFGRMFMTLDILIGTAFIPGVLERLFNLADNAAFDWFAIVDVGMVGPVLLWRAYLLWRMQQATIPSKDATLLAAREALAMYKSEGATESVAQRLADTVQRLAAIRALNGDEEKHG